MNKVRINFKDVQEADVNEDFRDKEILSRLLKHKSKTDVAKVCKKAIKKSILLKLIEEKNCMVNISDYMDDCKEIKKETVLKKEIEVNFFDDDMKDDKEKVELRENNNMDLDEIFEENIFEEKKEKEIDEIFEENVFEEKEKKEKEIDEIFEEKVFEEKENIFEKTSEDKFFKRIFEEGFRLEKEMKNIDRANNDPECFYPED